MKMAAGILLLLIIVGACALLVACRKRPSVASAPLEDSVFFSVQQTQSLKDSDGEKTMWLGTYQKEGKTARFRVELSMKEPKPSVPFSFGKGVFYREEGSDSSVLLKDLAKCLQAKQPIKAEAQTNSLQFTTAILGRNLSRGPGKDSLAGSFTSDPKGDWLAIKVSVADGEGEFFLNLNPKTSAGEFSLKDPDYGGVVLRELSRVF